MTYADRMKEIEDTAYALRCNAELSLSCGHKESIYKNHGLLKHFGSDVPFLISRVVELESALGEAMRTMRDDTDVFNCLTAIKEGRHE